jgi:prepilin-type N-terminal cleavage/methylation domain-containing protein
MRNLKSLKNAGFTLVELMVAMGITMVILYAAVQAFRDASQSSQMVTSNADMTDNLRAGLNLIEQDLQQTGTGIPVGGIPIPYTSNNSPTVPCSTTPAINRPILGGATTFPPCNSSLPAIEPGQAMGPLITAPDATAGNPSNPSSFTDEITILYADNSVPLDAKPINKPATAGPPADPGCPAGQLKLNGNTLTATFDVSCVNLTTAGIQLLPGDLIMFSNTNGSALLTVTGVAGQVLTFAPGDAFQLNGRTEAGGTINYLMTGLACGGAPSCFPPTLATRIWMVSYYLDNISSPPFVRLIRQVNFNPPTPVGETLENMQFTYNYVDGATNPSNQPGVPTANNESQIRSVNVFLGARSGYRTREGTRSLYSRNNLVTQISLRSMAYRDRYN